MLVQCWNSVINDGTTFNQHWVSASCWQPRSSMTWNASAHSKTKYLLISQECRYRLLKVLLQTRRRQWHQRKGSIYLIYNKWANTAFWQRYGRKSQLKSSKCLVYQGTNNGFWLCTGRTDVDRMLTTDVCLESQTKNVEIIKNAIKKLLFVLLTLNNPRTE